MKYSREWERINNNTDRLKVPGGWLVYRYEYNTGITDVMCFISDKTHSWKLKKEE